jgi:hypothetical protein
MAQPFSVWIAVQALKRLIGRLHEFKAIFVDRSLSPINTGLSSGWQIALGSPLCVDAISRQELEQHDINWKALIGAPCSDGG